MVCKLIITSNLTVAKGVLNSWLVFWMRIGLDFDNMFRLGCPSYATKFLFFDTFICLEIWKISSPELLKRLLLVFAGAVHKAGPDSMLILCLFVNLGL